MQTASQQQKIVHEALKNLLFFFFQHFQKVERTCRLQMKTRSTLHEIEIAMQCKKAIYMIGTYAKPVKIDCIIIKTRALLIFTQITIDGTSLHNLLETCYVLCVDTL